MCNDTLQRLCGTLDQNLHELSKQLHIRVARKPEAITVSGENADLGLFALEKLLPIAEKREIDNKDIRLAIVGAKATLKGEPGLGNGNEEKITLKTSCLSIQGKTLNQDKYLRSLLNYDITFGLGPAGTGKTYLAVATAVVAMENHQVEKIILVRPAVEAGEKLGFLPGDLSQKIDPYLRPLYDALYDFMGYEKVARLMEKGQIELAPLAYMRGRTLNNAYIILDEAQNTTKEQMKMFLTRVGFGARAVITGDLSQIDLPVHVYSGLKDVCHKLQNIEEICFHYFTSNDIIRHPLVQKIVDAYDENRTERTLEYESD